MRAFFMLLVFIGMGGDTLVAGEYEKAVYEKSFAVASQLLLHLDIDAADIKVHPNDEDACKVFIEYDQRHCEIKVNYDHKDHELDIAVDHDEIDIVKDKKSDTSAYATIRIDLPNRSPIDIDGAVKAGKWELQLGGLSIRNLILASWAAEVLIDFAEPNRLEIDRLDLDCKIGSIKLLHLGNARFKEVEINSAVGELTVDFSGVKMERAMARIDLEIGKTKLIVPKDIGVKIKVAKFLFFSEIDYPRWFQKRGSYYYSRNYDVEEKSLYLSLSTGIGEVTVELAK